MEEEKKYYEFQTAKICEAEAWNETVRQTIEERNMEETVEARKIAVVPDFVTINHIETAITDLASLPIGIAHKTIKPLGIDVRKNLLYFILAGVIYTRTNSFKMGNKRIIFPVFKIMT